MKRRLTIFLLLLLAVSGVWAQSDTLYIPSMEEVYRQNYWLSGSNPVGISFNRFHSFSVAKAGYSNQNGNLGNPSHPASAHTYHLFSESFRKIEKVALYGKLGFLNQHKNDINWNGMSGNNWHGMNLCDSVAGNQRSEQYQLEGALSLPFGLHWQAGARFDYLVETTAKDTDPRNKNQRMEWKLTPGIGYIHKNLRIGASLSYINRKEDVDYQNVGTHIIYHFLVAYPMGFYKTLPRQNQINWKYAARETGGALQLEIRNKPFLFFQEVSGKITKEKIVSDRINDRKENETDGWQIEYKGCFSKSSAFNRHTWDWQVCLNRFLNHDPLQQQTGAGTWDSYGKVLRSSDMTKNFLFTYRYELLHDNWNPFCSVTAGFNFRQEKSDLFFYPVTYTQPVRRFSINAAISRNFFFPHGHLDCLLGGQYGKGGGSIMNEKQSHSSQSSPDIKLWQDQERFLQEFRTRTEPRYSVHSSITYTHTSSFSWLIQVSGNYEKAYRNKTDTNTKYISIQIGLLF